MTSKRQALVRYILLLEFQVANAPKILGPADGIWFLLDRTPIWYKERQYTFTVTWDGMLQQDGKCIPSFYNLGCVIAGRIM